MKFISSNLCGCEKYPLLRTINRVLRNYPGPGPNCKLDAAAASLRMNPNFFSNLYNPVVPTTALSQIQCASAVKHFSDCSKYYECKFGRLWEATCPKGYYFNEVIFDSYWGIISGFLWFTISLIKEGKNGKDPYEGFHGLAWSVLRFWIVSMLLYRGFQPVILFGIHPFMAISLDTLFDTLKQWTT